MDRIDSNLARRTALAATYAERLARLPQVSWPRTVPGARHAHHLFPIWVPARDRDATIQALQAEQIGVVVNYRAIHLLTYFRETFGFVPGSYPVAEEIGDRSLSLPFYPSMPAEHVDRVVGALERALASLRVSA
jgi:UDP-4-amino-4-deoxy-L-arabinose-oxoglutarate aminotransferase